MTSIRQFLIAVSVAVITLICFIAALQGYRSGLSDTEDLFDEKLIERAIMIAALSSPKIAASELPLTEHMFFQVIDSEGRVIRRSTLAPESPLPELHEGFSSQSFGEVRWRVYASGQLPSGLRVVVGESTDNRYFLAEGIILRTVTPILLGLPFLLVLVWLIVSRGLQPLKNLTREVAHKKPQDLSPLHQTQVPAEIKPLVDAMNGLLSRLASSFEREKRFSGDAAHELRTPLSALKIHLFNLKKRVPDTDPDMQSMEESVTRMAHLIEQMLLLYRLSPEQFRAEFSRCDLYEVTRQVIAENYPLLEERGQEIELVGESITMEGNEFALRTLLKNLIDNANKYTPRGGAIRVDVHRTSEEIILEVEDSGPGIPGDLRVRVKERFYRVDGDKHSSQVQGCGLGLSIVQYVVDLHHGEMYLENSSFDSGLKVVVTIPLIGEDTDAL